MRNLLSIHDLAVGYKGKELLENISFEMRRGEMVALVGRNGTGKTTLLKTICGVVNPLSGKVMVEDRDVASMLPRERAQLISIVFTQRIQLQGINVRALVEMGLYPSQGRFHFSSKKNDGLVDSCILKLKIEHLAEKPLSELSDGELQKAMIARALAQQTPLILMDEPSAFLDYVAKEELFELLSSLVKEGNIGILFSSHDLEIVRKYAVRIVLVENNKAEVKTSFA